MKTPLLNALLEAAARRDRYRDLLAEARRQYKLVLEAEAHVRKLRGMHNARSSSQEGRAA